MKKNLLITCVLVLTAQLHAQQRLDWKSLRPEERKSTIQKMNPQQRSALLQQFREEMVVSEIAVPETDQEKFKNLYNEYQAKQNDIKSKFKGNDNYDNMSDEEARRRLQQSFDVGQQLLDNRKIYAEKFLNVIRPQQVLHMYQTEGKMRNKVLNRKQDGQKTPH